VLVKSGLVFWLPTLSLPRRAIVASKGRSCSLPQDPEGWTRDIEKSVKKRSNSANAESSKDFGDRNLGSNSINMRCLSYANRSGLSDEYQDEPEAIHELYGTNPARRSPLPTNCL